MKLVKLSLVAALAAGSFSALSAATALEEAIKDVQVDGELRYRYDTGRWKDGAAGIDGQSSNQERQNNRIRVRAGAKADIGEGFKVYGQLQYGNDRNGGYGTGVAQTDRAFNLRQAYVQYDSDYNLGFIAGRQQLNTIWTNDIVGFAGKGYYTGVEGLTLAAFAVDSFENNDGDEIETYHDFLFRQNLYGAAAIGSFDTGFGTIKPQAWLSYLNNRAFFYALNADYNIDFSDSLNWGLSFTYLGNKVEGDLYDYATRVGDPKTLKGGNLFNLAGTIEAYGFDGTLGGLLYGKKERVTFNTIEDTGNFGLDAGKEIFYLQGSRLTESAGKNTFVYGKAGYTFADLRVGAQIVYGGTKTGLRGADAISYGGGEKTEYVAEVSYKLSKKIGLLGYYSYVDYDPKTNGFDSEKKNTIRFQASYKF